jgi:hypothetical protein
VEAFELFEGVEVGEVVALVTGSRLETGVEAAEGLVEELTLKVLPNASVLFGFETLFLPGHNPDLSGDSQWLTSPMSMQWR